jgi:hypothetical protein|uniref:Uncharacterized protein n=1 Tax=Mesoaciditoga lauensis TaxID=1495039 RepID=A0A7V3VSG8_9BACT
MSEKSREFFAEWLFDHKPEVVVINSIGMVEFFRIPFRISLKYIGNSYLFAVQIEKGERFELEIESDFNALCSDKYDAHTLLIVDSKSSIEIVEDYKV